MPKKKKAKVGQEPKHSTKFHDTVAQPKHKKPLPDQHKTLAKFGNVDAVMKRFKKSGVTIERAAVISKINSIAKGTNDSLDRVGSLAKWIASKESKSRRGMDDYSRKNPGTQGESKGMKKK